MARLTTWMASPAVAGSTGPRRSARPARVRPDHRPEHVAGDEQQRGVDRGQPARPLQYMISRKSTAKLARPWNSEASREADMVGTRKMDSGSMGSATPGAR
jgi:hypothetical protein